MKPLAHWVFDVTATLLMGLAVGMFGLFAVVFWWLAIGVVGFVMARFVDISGSAEAYRI